jgi:hypothetical protein
MLIVFLSGMFCFVLIYTAYRVMQRRFAAMNLPVVIVIDLTTFKMYAAGIYMGITNQVMIPVSDSVTTQLWAVQTDQMYVLPSYGSKEDIIIEDSGLQNIVIMLCQVIGLSTEGDETHAEWCKDVFPPELYEVPQQLKELDHRYLFVRPLGAKNMVRTTIRQKTTSLRHVFAQSRKMMLVYEQEIKELYEYQNQLFSHLIHSGNQIAISNWQSNVEIYDTLLKERQTPLEGMARLLHIPQTKLAYSSLNAVLSHGGMSDAARFVGSLNQSLQGLANSMNMTIVNSSIQRAVTAKANQMQGDLFAARDQRERAIEVAKQLAESARLQDDRKQSQPALAQGDGIGNQQKVINI